MASAENPHHQSDLQKDSPPRKMTSTMEQQANHSHHHQQELIRLIAQHFNNQLHTGRPTTIGGVGTNQLQMPMPLATVNNFQSALAQHYQQQQQQQQNQEQQQQYRMCQDAMNFTAATTTAAQNRAALNLDQQPTSQSAFLAASQQGTTIRSSQAAPGVVANMNPFGLINPLLTATGPNPVASLAGAAAQQHHVAGCNPFTANNMNIFNALNCFGGLPQSNQFALSLLQQQYLIQAAAMARDELESRMQQQQRCAEQGGQPNPTNAPQPATATPATATITTLPASPESINRQINQHLMMGAAGKRMYNGNLSDVSSMSEMTPNQPGTREPALKFSINTILGRGASPTFDDDNDNNNNNSNQFHSRTTMATEANTRVPNQSNKTKFSTGDNHDLLLLAPFRNNNTSSTEPEQISPQTKGHANTGCANSRRDPLAPRPKFDQAASHQSARNIGSSGQSRKQQRNCASPSSTGTKTDPTDLDAAGDCGTALSSLTNFVSNSLAPIFGDELAAQSCGGNSKRSPSSGHNHQRSSSVNRSNNSQCRSNNSLDIANSGNNNNDECSGNESSLEDDKSSMASSIRISKNTSNNNTNTNSSSKPAILSAVSNALKAIPTGTVATTINTTLAKAPLELVQKQPAWVFCTRYSDRPSSGPRTRRAKSRDKKPKDSKLSADEKRPRTAFTSEQLEKLREEFQANSYLDEKRRKSLAERLCLNENQIKIWFQNKRAKMKKQSNQPNPLRGLLVAGGLYNHSTATSDCSESYANGLADDIGNRIIRDVEGEEDDEEDEQAAGGEQQHDEQRTAAANRANDEMENVKVARLLHKQQTRSLKSINDRAAGRGGDQDNDNNNNSKEPTLAATGDKPSNASQMMSAALKRRHASQSDGDDEDEDNSATATSSSANVIKRTKLTQVERNQRLAISHANISRLVESDRSSGASAPALATDDDEDHYGHDDDEEPVISVS